MSNTFTRDPLSSFNVFKNMTNVPRRAQQHLARVYSTLAACIGLSALGVYAQMNNLFIFNAGYLTVLAMSGAMFGIMALPYNVQHENTRWGLLWCFSFFQGISLGSLLESLQNFQISPVTILLALIATLLIFVCFTISALFTARRSYLYLGAVLSSALSMIIWISFANIFLRWNSLFDIELYIGLLAFCGYVVYDTQVIVEKANAGDYDVVGHTVKLFSDMVSVFVRILAVLIKKEKDKREENRKERRTRGFY